LKKASTRETEQLVELMAEFYAESGFPLNRRHATATFTTLLSDPRPLKFVRSFCTTLEARAIYLEVGRDNTPAQAVYRQMGFVKVDRQLMALPLADPTHAVSGNSQREDR